MIVFALDTALDACSVAVVASGETLAHACEAMARGQAERIAPMAREAMETAGLNFSEIDRIAVTVGPGSFTGVRVGLAFARGLSAALQRPCVGISTLQALALEAGEDGLRGAIIDTPGALYAAIYENGAPLMAPMRMERADAPDRIAAFAQGRRLVLRGPGAEKAAHGLADAEGVDIVSVNADALARRAARLDPESHKPHPLYLRAPVGEVV
jgi:tRNA threonylcarbamoyladenosine biosynthesis protein TsaB